MRSSFVSEPSDNGVFTHAMHVLCYETIATEPLAGQLRRKWDCLGLLAVCVLSMTELHKQDHKNIQAS